MTKKEIIKVLTANVRRLRREYNTSKRGERERLRLRLEEAERIRNAILEQNSRDRRSERLENLL